MLPPGTPTLPAGMMPTAWGEMPPGMAVGMAPGMWHGMPMMPGMPGFPTAAVPKSKKDKGKDKDRDRDKDAKKDRGSKKDKKGKKKQRRRSSSNSSSTSSSESSSPSKTAKHSKSQKKKKKKKHHKNSKKKRSRSRTPQRSRSRDRKRRSSSRNGTDVSAIRAAAAAIAAAASCPTRPPRSASPMFAAVEKPPERSPTPPKVPPVEKPPMTAAEKAAAAAAAVESRAKALEGAVRPKLYELQGVDCADPQARGYHAPEKIDVLLFPKTLIGRIIGKGGCIIKDINERSGARVDAREQTNDPVQVLISGTTEAVERAKSMILDIAEGAAVAMGGQDAALTSDVRAGTSASSGSSAIATESIVPLPSLAAGEGAAAATALLAKPDEGLVVGGDIVEEFMDLPKHVTGKIIGTGGKQVAEIRQKTGTQVDIDKSSNSCRIRVVGTKEAIEEAKKLIAQIAEAPAPTGENPPGFTGELMEIPRNSVGRVIGAGGARIQELQERSGAKIDIDRSTEKCMVRFAGAAEAVAKAKVLVTEVLEGRDRSVGDSVETMDVPPSTTGRLIGPGGKQINEIQEKSGAKVDIDKTRDPCIVRMAGTSEAVAIAKAMVLDVVHSVAVNQPRPQDLQNSIARAAAMAQALRAGLYPGGAGSSAATFGQDDESIKFEIPLALADKVLGNGAWVQAVRLKTGARITVNRMPDKCYLEMSGQPEQVIEAEQLAEDAVKNVSILVAQARDVPLPPPPASLLPEPQRSVISMPNSSSSFAGSLAAVPKVVAPPPGAGTVMSLRPLTPGPIIKQEMVSADGVAPGALAKHRPPVPPSDISPESTSKIVSAICDAQLESPPPNADVAIAAAVVLPARPSASRAAINMKADPSSVPGFGTPGKPGPGDPGLPPEMLPSVPTPTAPAPRGPPARVQAPWAPIPKAPEVQALTPQTAKAPEVQAPAPQTAPQPTPLEAPPAPQAPPQPPQLETPPPPQAPPLDAPPPQPPAFHAYPPAFMHQFPMMPSWQAPVALLPMVMSPWQAAVQHQAAMQHQAAVQHLPIPPPPQGPPPADTQP